jgi:hypothetical protein
VTEIVLIGASIREVRLRLALRWPLRRLAGVAGAAAVAAAVLAAGLLVNPFVQLAVGALAYGAALAASGALRRADVAPFIPALGRSGA